MHLDSREQSLWSVQFRRQQACLAPLVLRLLHPPEILLCHARARQGPTLSLSCSGTAGSYLVTVTGTSSGLTHSTSVTYTIQDFAIAANQTNVTILAGTSGTTSITTTGLQGFSGTISLTVTASPPTGLA